ncbi:MAG: exodeoxyribonuclease VII large subunit [Chlorobi bacterium]|nr:exodeoxyribonuclease VII large subunit [Chlorobiota bacterium]
MPNYISLSELNVKVRETVENTFSDRVYIAAEISELRENRGHAYLELMEKNEDDTVKAKAGAVIWARTYGMLKSYFESNTGRRLEAGLKILVAVRVVFHEVYGYRLNIIDIDPSYTVGEIERKRILILKRLEEEGVTEMNKELDFPLVPQRIAVISSDTAAGFGDFKNQLDKSPFRFEIKLFKAAVQGEETEKSVVEALEMIFKEEDSFDLVVIIRGGGSKSDLSWFDSYKIAVNIAQFPLPVLTGIGHERDKSVSDVTAYASLNTPTAVAEFLIDKMTEFYNLLDNSAEYFYRLTKDILSDNKVYLSDLSNDLKFAVNRIVSEKKREIDLLGSEYIHKIKEYGNNNLNLLSEYAEKLRTSIKLKLRNEFTEIEMLKVKLKTEAFRIIKDEKHHIELAEQKNKLSDPSHLLKAGYSYTLKNGKLLRSAEDAINGDFIETVLFDGKIRSEVKN